jgi:hypothetical protein
MGEKMKTKEEKEKIVKKEFFVNDYKNWSAISGCRVTLESIDNDDMCVISYNGTKQSDKIHFSKLERT